MKTFLAGAGSGRCISPTRLDEFESVLLAAAAEGVSVDVLGAGTQTARADVARAAADRIGLSMLGWEGVDVFEPDEGVVHVRCGTRVAVVQEIVGKEGWELPLDPLSPDSTLGGVLATAVAGPRAQAFGRVADAVLGIEVLGADARHRKCGGRVVKNVTGYDLAKLYCGSYGTLGVLMGAWLRLRPAPATRLAFRSSFAGARRSGDDLERARALRDRATLRVLTLATESSSESASPSSSHGSKESLFFELGGSAVEVAADRARIEEDFELEAVPVDVIDRLGDARRPVFESFRPRAEPESVSFEARVLGNRLADFVKGIRDRGFAVSIDLGLATVFASGRFESFAEFVDLRRQAEAAGGFLVVRAMPRTWRGEVDALSMRPPEIAYMKKIRDQFDPDRRLNPDVFGAGPGERPGDGSGQGPRHGSGA